MENKNNKQVEESRAMTKYDKKMQKKNEATQKAKKKTMAIRGTAIAVILVVAALAIFAIVSTVSKSVSYIKVDDKSISREEFDFYYMRVANYYGNMYTNYGVLDSSKPLAEQSYSENLTWEDYFEQLASEEIVRVKALLKDADKNGFKEDVEEEYNDYIKTLEEDAKANKMNEKEYYEAMFGSSKKDVEDYMKEYLLAEKWYNKKSDDMTATDDDIEAYYQAHKADYDCVDYYVYAATPAGIDMETVSEEDYNAAMITARMEAELVLSAVELKGTLEENVVKADVSENLAAWLFDDARVEGEKAVVDDNDNSTIYAVKFLKRYRDESPTANIRAMITMKEDVDAQALLDEWKAGEATEESFVEMVNANTDDTSVTDGLYEGVTKYGMEVEALTEWMFDSARAEGDTFATTTDDGYKYVVYYKGANDPDYKFAIKETLLAERMSSYVEELMDAIKVADPNGELKYLQVAGE